VPAYPLILTSLWAYVVTQFAELTTHPAELVAGAALAAATLIAVAVTIHFVGWPCRPADPARHASILRDRARRSRVPRQIDPDASGRPRPRAPSASPSAA